MEYIINSFEDILNCKKKTFDDIYQDNHLVFRGEGNKEYSLLSKLGRIKNTEIELEKLEKKWVNEFYKKLEENNLTKIIQNEFLNYDFHREWLRIQQAQHLGIPTRFLDWTSRIEVAIYFATEKPENDHLDGHIWFMKVPKTDALNDQENVDYLNINPYEFKKTKLLFPSGTLEDYFEKTGLRRKNRQCGSFLIQSYQDIKTPLNEQEQFKDNLFRIIIPKELKAEIGSEISIRDYTKEWEKVKPMKEIEDIIEKVINFSKEKYSHNY